MTSLYDLVETDIQNPIHSDVISSVLCKPPFIPVPGVLNFRDLGLLPASPIQLGLIYRSGALPCILPPSTESLLRDQLGIKVIIDLRSATERASSPDPVIEGVENVWVESEREPKAIDLDEFVVGEGEEEVYRGYVGMYMESLEIYREAFRTVLERVAKGVGGVLVHCTAGKDRTGVLCAVLLCLAGCSAELVAHDYALSRLGAEPHREMLLGKLLQWNKEWTMKTPGMLEFSQIKPGIMMRFLEEVERKYGSVEEYVKGSLGFSGEDLVKIRKIWRGPEIREAAAAED